MDTDHQATLAALQTDFPAFSITRETTLNRPRYIARSLHLTQRPHTLITADPAELRAALATATGHGITASLCPVPNRWSA